MTKDELIKLDDKALLEYMVKTDEKYYVDGFFKRYAEEHINEKNPTNVSTCADWIRFHLKKNETIPFQLLRASNDKVIRRNK